MTPTPNSIDSLDDILYGLTEENGTINADISKAKAQLIHFFEKLAIEVSHHEAYSGHQVINLAKFRAKLKALGGGDE